MSDLERVDVYPAKHFVVLGVNSLGGDGTVVVLTKSESSELRAKLSQAEATLTSEFRCSLCRERLYTPRPSDPLWQYCDNCADLVSK